MAMTLYVHAGIRQKGSNPHFGNGLAVIGVHETGAAKIETHLIRKGDISTPTLELKAAILAAKLAPNNGCVISVTSEYVHSGITKWVSNWATNGWRSKQGREVKNRELWEELLALGEKKIVWIKEPPKAVTTVTGLSEPSPQMNEIIGLVDDFRNGAEVFPTHIALDQAELQDEEVEYDFEPSEMAIKEAPAVVTPLNYGAW